MPALTKIKFYCPSCGWHIVLNVSDYNPTWVTTCARCGSSSVRSTTASLVEWLNPIEAMRGVTYELGRLLRGK